MTRPPGVVLLAVGYGAGLATGLSHLMAPGLVVAIVGLAAIALRGAKASWLPPLLALAAGVAAGTAARADSTGWCAARLPLGERSYRVRSVDPGEGTGRVLVIGARCAGTVIARWPRTTRIPAGSILSVTGRWSPSPRPLGRPDGMLMIGATGRPVDAADALERARTMVIGAAAALYGHQAPIAEALVAGWRGELDPEFRAALASAGLMHLLAISGLHVAWLGASVLMLLRLARAPRHPAECAAALAAVAYVAFLGWPAAGFRASLVLLIAAGCRWRQRQVQWRALLATSALVVMIVQPWAISEPGAWLSVLGLSGVVHAIRWSDRAIGTSALVRSLSGSTGALIATAPVAAAVFGQVAPIGIVLNVAGLPLLLLILPALFASIVLYGIIPSAAVAIAASGNGLLALLELLARLGAHAPGAAEAGRTGMLAAIPWLGALAAALWISHDGTTRREAARRAAWCAIACMGLTLVPPHPVVADAHALTLLFVDVGQGDAALLRTPSGHWIEVDAGPVGEGRDAGRRVVTPLLAAAGASKLDLFVLSHAHRDHVGGGAGVFERIPVHLAIEPGELFADSAYDGWLTALGERQIRWHAVRAGAHWTIDGVEFRVLHPPSPWPRQGEDLNEDSVVLEVSFGGFRALMMGDAGLVAESAMTPALRPVNVLKVGHHGSRGATGDGFLAAIRPQVAIISVGRNNYGHPAPETLARLGQANAAVWRTDVDGTVRVTTDGRTFTVKGSRTAATFGTTH